MVQTSLSESAIAEAERLSLEAICQEDEATQSRLFAEARDWPRVLCRLIRNPSAVWFDILFDSSNMLTEGSQNTCRRMVNNHVCLAYLQLIKGNRFNSAAFQLKLQAD